MKPFPYIAALVLVIASWIGNGLYYRSSLLPEPLFLRHYIEVIATPGNSFELKYLENSKSQKKVTGIYIDELPFVIFQPLGDHTRYSHQSLGKMLMQFRPYDAPEGTKPEPDEGPLVIHKVRVYYSDGSQNVADIGEIRVYPDDRSEAAKAGGSSPFDFLAGSGSSDHSGSDSFQIKRPLRLTGYSSAYLEKLTDGLDVTAVIWRNLAAGAPETIGIDRPDSNSSPLTKTPLAALSLPFMLSQGDSLQLSYRFHFPAESRTLETAAVYRLELRLSFTDETGQKWSRLTIFEYSPDLTESDVRAIVRAGRDES